MRLEELSPTERRRRLRREGLRLHVGPFIISMRSTLRLVDDNVGRMYAAHHVARDDGGSHFHVSVEPPNLLRRLVRRQAQFSADGVAPFVPLPASMAAPMLEGGMNWCIGARASHLLAIHSATLESRGVGLLMPAPPGSGKSTLCAALVARGWRLLSDEFALIDPASSDVRPVPRPIALKDRSREIIREWWPDAVFSATVRNNENQLVAYVRPPRASVDASEITCRPRLILVPRYIAGTPTRVAAMTRARALMHLADSSFNYNLHGQRGFERLAEIAATASAATLEYSDLAEGVNAVAELARSVHR